MKKFHYDQRLLNFIFIIVIIALFAYSQVKFNSLSLGTKTLSQNISSLENKLASTTVELNDAISKNHSSLSNALTQEIQNVGTIEQRLGNYQKVVGTVSSTVDTLQKLSKTDPQLLQKYSKVFFLNEYYAPARLSEIPETYRFNQTKVLKINTDIWPHLKQMFDDSTKEGVPFLASSAYRSFNEQHALKSQYSVIYGAGTANQFSADQGYSEHQLGTAVDFTTESLKGGLEGFDKTSAYTWLLANAYKYGFIISYPKENKFYVFEPWHWRYVGIKLATDLHNAGQNFYDWDQRKIDEYLVDVF